MSPDLDCSTLDETEDEPNEADQCPHGVGYNEACEDCFIDDLGGWGDHNG